MSDRYIEKVENLDVTLFDAIPSQTSVGDRRSLLAVQRATGRKHEAYAYLEIGSYLGGSIQPYLVDRRCTKIYAVDARPVRPPDERAPEEIVGYPDNSTAQMLRLLARIDHAGIEKIRCFEADAAEIEPSEIIDGPYVAFIDGEHTRSAVLSDFAFCNGVIARGGTILFHDFYLLHDAMAEIVSSLRTRRSDFIPLKLDGNVFGIFYDPDIVHRDPFLDDRYRRRRRFWFGFRTKMLLRRMLPGQLHSSLRAVRFSLRRRRQSSK